MVNKFRTHAVAIILSIILIGGFLLRFHQYATWPREGATFDEYAWTWLGVNLIQKGIPISWSPHPQYTIRTLYIQRGAQFWLVRPYLEHPPLFGLVAGGYALLRGIPNMYHVRIPVIRELALILGVLSIYLVYLLGSRVYSPRVGLWASGIYAIMPTVAVGSRIIENENFFIPLFLLILYCVHMYVEKKSQKHFIAAVVLCGLATLAKVPWFAATVSVTMILLLSKKIRQVFYLWIGVFLIFSLFIIYGFAWDKQLFLALWNLQLHRYDLTFDSIFALFTQPFLVDRYFLDGWIYAGWAAYVVLLTEKIEKHTYVIFGLLGYFLVYVAAIPNEPDHGWYRYPFYPFLALAIGYFADRYLLKYRLISAAFLLLIGLSLLSHTWTVALGFSFTAYRLYIAWTGVGLLPIWFPNKKIVALSNISTYLQIAAVALLSVFAIIGYNEQ